MTPLQNGQPVSAEVFERVLCENERLRRERNELLHELDRLKGHAPPEVPYHSATKEEGSPDA